MSDNLWDAAAATLSEKEKASLDFASSRKLDELLALVNERKAECLQRRWSVKRSNGKERVVLHDVFAKIAVWIDKFVEVGDMAMQYDPGHAALPWAGVRLLPKLSTQDARQHLDVLEGIEQVSRIITYYYVVERIYLQEKNEITVKLKASIVEFYATVLSFLVRVRDFFAMSTAARALQGVFDWNHKFQSGIEAMHRQEVDVVRYTELVDGERQKALGKRLSQLTLGEQQRFDSLSNALQILKRPIDRMDAHLQTLQDGIDIEQRVEILQWVSKMPYMQHHYQTRKDILPRSGAWFLNDKQLYLWYHSSSSSIMWLHGSPGTGKSKLVSILLDQLSEQSENGRNPDPVYFYCTRNPAEPERARSAPVLRSLVRQTACLRSGTCLLETIRRAYLERKADGFAAGPLTLEECTILLRELTQQRSLTVIVIDALDECEPDARDELLKALFSLVHCSSSLVKVLISSREDRSITCQMSDCLNLQISATKNRTDINRFIDEEVERLVKEKRLLFGKVSGALKQHIKNVLRTDAHGMFRWVSLQLQYIRGLRLETDVWKRLGKLPTDLRKLYEETYVQIMGAYEIGERSIAEAALRLLLCLERQLSTKDFLVVLSYSQDDIIELSTEELLDLCFNFVIEDSEADVLRFAHLSVRDFLETRHGFSREENNATSAKCCFQYLLSEEVLRRHPSITSSEYLEGDNDRATNEAYCNYAGDSWDSLGLGPLHIYFAHCWPLHLDESRAYSDLAYDGQGHLQALCRRFMIDEQCNVAPGYSCWRADMMRCGIHWAYQYIFETHDDQTSDAFLSSDYLATACEWDLIDIVKRRIDKEPQVLEKKITRGYTPLGLACYRGNLGTVKLLVEKGASLQGRSGYEALHAATQGRNLGVMRFLLQHDVHPSCTDIIDKARTPLFRAIEHDDPDEVRLLLSFGADPLDCGGLLLKTAMEEGRAEVIPLLLDCIEELTSSERKHIVNVSQMHRAVNRRHSKELHNILKNWSHAEELEPQLSLALCRAVENLDHPCTKHLLAKGADPNTRLKSPTASPLYPILVHAITLSTPHREKIEHCALLESLLAYGADPSPLPSFLQYDGSILWHAVELGFEATTRALLDTGVDLNTADITNRSGLTQLHNAVIRNRVDLVRDLVDGGADVNAQILDTRDDTQSPALASKWEPGLTALDIAVQQEFNEIREYLREHRAVPCAALGWVYCPD